MIKTIKITNTPLYSMECFLQNFKNWLLNKLPVYNTEIEQSNIELIDLILPVKAFAQIFHSKFGMVLPFLAKKQALQILQYFGFCISSIERHLQAEGKLPGSSFKYFQGLEDILLDLGKISNHVPRDSHYTYWLSNQIDGEIITFTGSDQEKYFNKSVNLTHELFNRSCELIRKLVDKDIPLWSLEAIENLEKIESNYKKVWDQYKGFTLLNKDSNLLNMEPHFFMKRMRTYLTTYPIGGVTYSGPNAANVAAQPRIDYLVGIVNDSYYNIVEQRMLYMHEDEKNNMVIDMQKISLTDLLYFHLHDEVDNEIKFKILIAYKKILKATSLLTNLHMGLIHRYLTKAAENLTPEEIAKLPVKPTHGTGGKTHDETAEINLMRTSNPRANEILKYISEKGQ